MSDYGRSPRKLLVLALALPVFAIVYVTTFGARLWAGLRPAVATFLGATVIGSIYAETAYRKTPTPVRAAAVVALSITLIAPQLSTPATVRAADPAQAVIAAAKEYLGHPYMVGQEGPKYFDCSGLVYRAFSDAGELPRIGGMRLRAAGYMQYFVSRGRFTRNEADAVPGDLIVYNQGEHIAIYLGDDKAISALINPWGVSIHSVHGVREQVSYYLHVNWGGGDATNPGDPGNGGGNNDGNGNGNGGDNTGNNGGAHNGNNHSGNAIDGAAQAAAPKGGPTTGTGDGNGGDNGTGDGNGNGGDNNGGNGTSAVALGTMNLRLSADPTSRIIGWIGRGGTFTVVDQGNSPAGFLWFKVQTKSGKQGWVYSRWVKTS